MATLTHWKKLENPDYIGAYAFQPGERKALTILKATREMIHGIDGKKEECTLVYWKENEKPLILNATNGKMISKVAGTPFIEEWPGKRVTLRVEKVKAFGEVVDAVRVDKEAPKAAMPEQLPPCEDCGGIIVDAMGFKAAKIAQAGHIRYGIPLCMDCAEKRKRAVSGQEDASDRIISEDVSVHQGEEEVSNENDLN